jgi:hypothetical protein
MSKWICKLFIFVGCTTQLSAQHQPEHKYFVGGYYTFLIDPVIMESTLDTVQLFQNYLNVNFRYAFNHKWRIGAEYIMMITATEGVDDPFSTFGLTVDYDILRAKRSKLNLRVGISFGNLSFAGDVEPKKRFVVNRVIGGSYEFRITKIIWLNAGIYSHLPFNKIEYKYAMVQPFIGVCVGM